MQQKPCQKEKLEHWMYIIKKEERSIIIIKALTLGNKKENKAN